MLLREDPIFLLLAQTLDIRFNEAKKDLPQSRVLVHLVDLVKVDVHEMVVKVGVYIRVLLLIKLLVEFKEFFELLPLLLLDLLHRYLVIIVHSALLFGALGVETVDDSV